MTLNRITITSTFIALASASMLITASPAFAITSSSSSPSRDDSFNAYAWEVGDDNADGVIDEDESGWDCTTMGNLVCGPGNGVQAGQYEAGKLVPWSDQLVPAWCKDICLGA